MTVPGFTDGARGGYRHEAAIVDDDDELLDAAVPFLRDGVAAGAATLVRLEPRRERLVLDALGDSAGVTVLPFSSLEAPVSALRSTYALVAGANGAEVRLLGEVPHEPWSTWSRYEAACNRAFAELPLWGLCAFDTRESSSEVLVDVERTHPLVRRNGAGVANPRYTDPAAFLADRARRETDALESSDPDVEVLDPTLDRAMHVVAVLAESTLLDREAIDALRLSAAAVITNARSHGRLPVRLRVWATLDRVIVTVTDGGGGPADRLVGLASDLGQPVDEASSLHQVYDALDEVSLFVDDGGFTVRLAQRCRR